MEIYDCPGHTLGSVAILIKNERYLFLGDACTVFTLLCFDHCTSIAEYEENLKKLNSEVKGKYDYILSSHGEGNIPIGVIEGNIQLCEDIKVGKTDDILMEVHGTPGILAKGMDINGRFDGGIGNIVYLKDHIW